MKKGFTLIELLVVVLIIGVLSAVALPQYQTAVERARATEALTQMNAIVTSAQRYHSQHEFWPSNFNKLDVDIPADTSCTSGYGGKNFCLATGTASTDGCDAAFCAWAYSKRNSHAYTLKTEVSENSNGTYSAVRKCFLSAATPSGDKEGMDYCYAIAGGADKAISGF